MSCQQRSRYPFSPPYYPNSEFAMTGVDLQQTFKYKYTLKQICHCEEQRDDAIWTVLTRLLHYVRNDRIKYDRNLLYNKKAPFGAIKGKK